ncbi:MAG: serine/threonine-protein kinase [Cyanobacteria bacterium P01_A01_bin.123]
MDRFINQILHNRYCVESLLGRQTGQRTFLARDVQTQSPVVVKLRLFGPDFTWDELKLFEREAETLKTLEHPCIPQYLDSFELDTPLGQGFALVQSYIKARSLHDWIQAGRTFSETELRVIATDLLEILDYLHTRQPPVIHRDIKPSNILLGNNRSGNSPGQVYLVDFGSVQTTAQGGTITVVGTYGYMPPEQFGGRTTVASDLYSLGATLIHLLIRTHPADLPMRNGRMRFEAEQFVSEQFQTWLQRLIQPDLDKRFSTTQLALKGLQSDLSTLQATQSARLKPKGSRVELTKTDDRLQILIPPLRIRQKLRVIYSGLGLTIFCCMPFLLVLWKVEALILVIPFVVWMVAATWINYLYKIFEITYLSIDQSKIRLVRNWFGIKRSHSSPIQDVIKIERLSYREQFDTVEYRGELKALYSGLTIWVGNQCFSLEKVNAVGGVHRLTGVELDWLAFELSDWLDLPVQRLGETTGQVNPNQLSGNTENQTLNDVDSQVISADNLNPVGGFSKISRPAHTKCTLAKNAETVEISAPASMSFGWVTATCLTGALCIFILIGGATISLSMAIILGSVPVVAWMICAYINRRRENTEVVLRIDQQNISLYEQPEIGQKQCFNQAERGSIYKLQLVYKVHKKYGQSCHVKIHTGDPTQVSGDYFLIGNRTFWLSRREAEWLANELSVWLKLPVTEVEVVESEI